MRSCTDEANSSSAIIQAIVSLASALNMETTAEGVKALDHLAHILEKGATYVQDWVYSKALANEDVRAKLSNGDFRFTPVEPERHRAERRTVFRRVGVIHEDQRYEAALRNLSKTGAMIEGLLNVPKNTKVVPDLGAGQLALATVRRSADSMRGWNSTST